jgi:hypothetical protein
MHDHDLPRALLRAAAVAIVPEAAMMSTVEWESFDDVIGRALAERPPAVRRQLALFLRVLDAMAVVRTGRRFATLNADRRAALLHGLERGRVLLLRRGVWGRRTIVFMGCYARPGAAVAIGYRADPRGWDIRA